MVKTMNNWDLPEKAWIVDVGNDFDLEKWRRKRKWTTRVFVLECLMLGMEYSVTFLTLWLYIKTLIDTAYPKIFYSLIASAYLLAAVLFSVVIGRWVDKTRKIRKTFLICNTLVILGNITYSLHFSPWLLVIGRLVSGADGPLRSVISGEVARCYPDDEVIGKFSKMGMAFALGFIMGPGVNFLFTTVDFQIGQLRVTYVNVVGLYMAALFLFTQICVIFMVSDLSREYDLKKYGDYEKSKLNDVSKLSISHFQKEKSSYFQKEKSSVPYTTLDSKASIDNQNTSFNPLASLNKYTVLDESVDQLLLSDSTAETSEITASQRRRRRGIGMEKFEQSGLFTQSFNISDCFATASMLLILKNEQGERSPLLQSSGSSSSSEISTVGSVVKQILTNVDTMLVLIFTFLLWFWMVAFDMWLPLMVVDVMEMGINELNGIVFGFGCISAVILFILSYKTFSDRILFKLSLGCMISLGVMEGIFIAFKFFHHNMILNVVLWVIWGTLFAIVVVMDEVFLVGALAKMVGTDVQTFSESIRLAMSRFGALIALLTSAMLFQWVEYVCTVGIVFSFIAFGLLLWRKSTLSCPKRTIH